MRCNNCSNEIDVSVGFQSIMVLGYVSVYERLGYRAICGNLLRREKCKKKTLHFPNIFTRTNETSRNIHFPRENYASSFVAI